MALLGCSSIESYKVKDKLGEGTFGHVYRAVHNDTGTVVALKEILLHNKHDGLPITALREIKILKSLKHENVIRLLDMAVKKTPRVSGSSERPRVVFSMVTPYMDHDLAGLLQNDKVRLTIPHIKCYMTQLLHGVDYLHQNQYMHRDIKAANILVDNMGQVKIADFGLARKYMEPPPTFSGASPSTTKYTATVVTRWYRPPELLLGEQYYTTAIDMWGVGCIFGEIFTRRPIFPGRSDNDQISLVFDMVGKPTQTTMPGYDKLPGAHLIAGGSSEPALESKFSHIPPTARSLLKDMLLLDPLKRLSAQGALAHEFFTTGPAASSKNELPIYTSSHELDARRRQHNNNNQQNGGGPSLPSRPDSRPNNRRRPRALGYKIPYRPTLYGEDLIPPYRRRKTGGAPPPQGAAPPNGAAGVPQSQAMILDY